MSLSPVLTFYSKVQEAGLVLRLWSGYDVWLLVMKKSKKGMWSFTSTIKILGKETGLEKDR